MSTNQNNTITLIKYKEVKIMINNDLFILILGITDKQSIFMRLNVNASFCYENLFGIGNNNIKDAFDFLLNVITEYKNEFESIDEGKKLFFKLYSTNPTTSNNNLVFPLFLKNNSDKTIIKNEDIMKSLYNFNLKYKTYIDESDTINLSHQNIDDEAFKDFSNIKLKTLVLFLNNNRFKDISPLNSENFKYLQKLFLINNEIVDLNNINNLKLDFLLELKLNHNKIEDISPLQNVQFKKIENLDLSENKISNLEAFKNIKFDNLINLNLSNNFINDIYSLEYVEFSKLIKLDLSHNLISDSCVFEKVNFPSIEIKIPIFLENPSLKRSCRARPILIM